MLTVFGNLFEVVGHRSELLEFLFKLLLHLHGDLIGALGNDTYGLIHVACRLRELNHVVGDGVERRI